MVGWRSRWQISDGRKSGRSRFFVMVAMTSAQGITKYGFRVWHERQLIECHIYLIACVISAVLALALTEVVSQRGPGSASGFLLVAIAAAGLLSVVALRRYVQLLRRAMSLAEQCVCPGCRAYGLVNVIATGSAFGSVDPPWMRVACQKCGYQWPLQEPQQQ